MIQNSKALSNNPLMLRDVIPAFDRIKPEHIVPAVEATVRRIELKLIELEKNIVPTYEGLVRKIEELEMDWEYTCSPIFLLTNVKSSAEMQKAYEEAMPSIISVRLKLSQSYPIYKGLKAIKDSSNFEKLNSAQKRVITNMLREAEQSGVELEKEIKDRFNKIENRCADLQIQFSNNIFEAKNSFRLIIENVKDTEGWPFYLKQLTANSYADEAKKVPDPENGPWKITLDEPCFYPFMQYTQNRNHRKIVYLAMFTVATLGESNNNEIIEELLRLRKQKANILGFKTFADLSLDSKMASSIEAIEKLSQEVFLHAKPKVEKQLKEQINFAKKNLGETEIKNWDLIYISEKFIEKSFGYTEEQLRPYFPLQQVLDGLFKLAKKLFNINIVKYNGPEIPKWHKDVQYFIIKDEKDKKIAGFYLDPYSRPKEKMCGAWMNDIFGRRTINGKVQAPEAYLICNGTPPSDNKPSLMSLEEVLTIFHEFGHILQVVLTTVDEYKVAGISGIEWDAAEIPSMFMENWCYHKETLLSIAKHYKTGEVLPIELFNKVKASRIFSRARKLMHQLEFGEIDMYLHHIYSSNDEETAFQAYKRIQEKYAVFPPFPDENLLCSAYLIFGDGSGYSAGYYTYLWSEVFSADAFAAFEEVGLENHEKLAKVGKRFRDSILSLGGSVHPSDVYRKFRGKDVTTCALLRHSGLKNDN